jgi:DNA glycosylase AlkZ-like
MAERVLTQRELNRALLARQLLLERARLPIPRALERIGGVQNQYAPNAYVRLWSCLEGFERDKLTRALERRLVAQGTLMRVTIHTVSKGDFPLLRAGLRRELVEWWLKVVPGRDARGLAQTAKKLRAALADGPRKAKELDKLLGKGWGGAALEVGLVRVPPSGTWEQRRADLYWTAHDWLGESGATEDEGVDHLVRRYLGGFGPAATGEIASWAGLNVKSIAAAATRLDLRRFRDEDGKELVDLPRAPLPDGETPAPVRFLPTWDAVLLVHARRTQVLPERYRPRVFNTKNPFSVGTFLVDGTVAGEWKLDKDRVRLTPYERLPKTVRRELDEEAGRLVDFHR